MPKLTKKYLLERVSQRRLAFLFGAGASIEAGLPDMTRLTDIVRAALIDKNARVMDDIRKIIKDRPSERINIENILDVSATLTKQLKAVKLKTDFPWSAADLSSFDEAVRVVISKTLASVRQATYVNNFVSKLFRRRSSPAPLWFFTTNNDVLIESALDYNGVQFRDGFVGYKRRRYDPRDLEMDLEAKRGRLLSHPARLCKLHGSITYGEDGKGPYEDSSLPDRSERQLIIYPSADKFEQSHQTPYHDFQSLLQRVITGVDTLIVSGYSFSDSHLNTRIKAAADTNSKLTVFAFLGELDGMESLFNNSKNIYGIGQRELMQNGTRAALPPDLQNLWKASALFQFIGGL